MENSRWFGVITVGLVIAALAVGYFLLTGKLSTKSGNAQISPTPAVLGQNEQINTPASIAKPTPISAYNMIVERNKGKVTMLPKTGFPIELAMVFSASAMTIGWGLRKFPH